MLYLSYCKKCCEMELMKKDPQQISAISEQCYAEIIVIAI